MECWYDMLFECNCAGITELGKIPCAGSWWTDSNYRNQYGQITPMARTLDPKIFKRVSWIANCSDVSGFSLIAFDDWRTNDFKVFMRVTSVRVWFPWLGGFNWKTVDLPSPSCYYLGKFQWYWDYSVMEPLWPISPRIGNILPWPYRASVTSGEYLPMNIYTKDDIVFFYGQKALDNIQKQQAFIDFRKARRTQCLKTYYPTPLAIKERQIVNQGTPMDWPGPAISEMTPPTPDAAPTPPAQAAPGTMIAKLTLYFGETPATRPDGLQITIAL